MAGRNGKAKRAGKAAGRGVERLVATLVDINGRYAALNDEWGRCQDRAKAADERLIRLGREEMTPAQDRLREYMSGRGLLAAVIGGHLVVNLKAFENGDHYNLDNYMSDSDVAILPLDAIPGLGRKAGQS
jgi:hypothetical protein